MPDKFDENLSAWMQSKDISLTAREKAELLPSRIENFYLVMFSLLQFHAGFQ